MKIQRILLVLMIIHLAACSIKRPQTESVSQPRLCVYGQKTKGVAEVIRVMKADSRPLRYAARFYPGDKVFEIRHEELDIEAPLAVGQELMVTKQDLLSGPESCAVVNFKTYSSPDY